MAEGPEPEPARPAAERQNDSGAPSSASASGLPAEARLGILVFFVMAGLCLAGVAWFRSDRAPEKVVDRKPAEPAPPPAHEGLAASLAFLPIHSQYDAEGQPSGTFVEVARGIGAASPAGRAAVKLYPFGRSIHNVLRGRADFHIPLIRVPEVEDSALPFAYATEPITRVAFVLYSNASKPPLDRAHLERYEIGTMRGHAVFFPFPVRLLSSIESGIQMVDAGRLDGYIMEQEAVDAYIRERRLATIRRALYREWDSCVVIAKGPRREAFDREISAALREAAAGELKDKILRIHRPYDDWQPSEMDW